MLRSRALAAFAVCFSLLLQTFGLNHFERIWERTSRARPGRSVAAGPAVMGDALKERAPHYRFLTSQTKKFQVTHLPDVNFDIGGFDQISRDNQNDLDRFPKLNGGTYGAWKLTEVEMYAGNIPIGTNASEALYFVFQPKLGAPVDEITIWLNGGPGCSSLEGFFQENGRFLWQWGVYEPMENPYTWVNLTNMLWVEQPIGTGFAIGTPTATNESVVAQQFLGFFENFQKTFGIKNFKIYVTGESYAGRYVPYISGAMVDRANTTYFDISGALVYDPCIGSYISIQTELPTYPWIVANQVNLNLNATFLAELEALDRKCGYATYRDKYMKFPPSGVQPPMYFNFTSQADCDIYDLAQNAILEVNPCFNPYWAIQQCPILFDPLGFPGLLAYIPSGVQIYFNRTDVKKAMHAPMDVNWLECNGPVFVGNGGPEDAGDTSPDPIQQVLPQVIEHTNRVLVGNADNDFVILTNGTLLSIQNMTWNGQLGFQTQPTTPINVTLPDLQYQALFASEVGPLDGPYQGIMGVQHYERGLMWVETYLSGHMQPQFQPRLSYRHLEWLLGRTDHI